MRHITYLIILNLLFLNVYNAESQITKKPIFTKATYEPLKVTQTTKVCDPESITLSASATNYCKLSKILNFAYQIDYNIDGTFEASGTGNQAVLGNHTAYKLGTHKIKWLVTDGCGGLSSCSKLVTIEKAKDNIKPIPIAKILSIELLPNNCKATLEAQKVNNNSYDNCTEFKKLRFRMVRAEDFNKNMSLSELLNLSENLTFEDEIGTFLIYFIVIDEDNNWDYVSTYIVVQNNMNPQCAQQEIPIYYGYIKYPNGQVFSDTNTRFTTYRNSHLVRESKVDKNGAFMIDYISFSAYSIYTVKYKNNKEYKDLTNINIVLLENYLNNKTSFTNSYARLAADINQDHQIDYKDLELLKLIENQDITKYFTKYIFIPKDYIFKNFEVEKDTIPDSVSFSNIEAHNLYYYSIKLGDIYSNLFYQPIDRSAIEKNSIQLFQNQPNPFSDRTKIIFESTNLENVQLDILDINGKNIYSKMLNAQIGYNELEINSSELNGAGVYIYQLKTSNSLLSKKMILTN